MLKRVFAFFICITLIIGAPISALAESGTEESNSAPALEESGAEAGAPDSPFATSGTLGFSGGTSRSPGTEPEPELWEVVGVKPGSQILYVKKGAQPDLPYFLPLTIRNQYGNTDYSYMDVKWHEASYDTSVCGSFEIFATAFVDDYYYEEYTQAEYTISVTLQVVESILPDLLNSQFATTPVLGGGYRVEARYPVPITDYDDILLETRFDESESWRDVQDVLGVSFDFSGYFLTLHGLENNVVYYFRLTVKGSGLLMIAFYLGERSLSEPFPAPFEVFFPYQPEPWEDTGSLVCADAFGNSAPARYTAESGRLAFSLDMAGEYTIRADTPAAALTAAARLPQQAEEAAMEPQASASPASRAKTAWPVAIGVTALIAGPLFWRWRLWRVGRN